MACVCLAAGMHGCGATASEPAAPARSWTAPAAAANAGADTRGGDFPSARRAGVSLASDAAGPAYSWTNVKIGGGGYITGLYFHPGQSGLLYARTDIGGAYRWGPNDRHWVPLLDFTSRADTSWAGVEAIGLDPTDPNKLYLAVGEYDAPWSGNGAMLISDDQGATFRTVPLSFQNGSNEPGRGGGQRIAVDPNFPSTLYFGTRDAGLEISADSGVMWNRSRGLRVVTANPDGAGYSESDGVVSVLPIAASGSPGHATPVVYAIVAGTGASGSSQGIYVTTQGGSAAAAWTPVAGQPSFASAARPLAPLQAVAGPTGAIYILYGDQAGPNWMNRGQLWEFHPASTWTSGTWTRIFLPNRDRSINDSDGYGGIAVDPTRPGYLLLSTLDQYWPTGDVIYYSTDDGATWRDVSSHTTPELPYSASPNLATHDDAAAPWMGAPNTLTTGNWATALAIDPFNPDHAVYGTGGGVWSTSDLTNASPSSTSTGVVNWTFAVNGIEETVVEGLWAPPSGSTILLSSLGDVYGFAHRDLSAAPASHFSNPAATPSSMDFEQDKPTTVVRVTDGSSGAAPVGVVSTDGGRSWTAFPSMPPGSDGGGTIAIAADGSSMVWATEDTSSVWYSKDGGSTWAASGGIAPQSLVASDRVKPGVYYGLSRGRLSISTNGGATFTTIQAGLPRRGILTALPDAQGDIWLTGGWQGSRLYANTGSAAAPDLTAVSGVEQAYHLAYGKAAPGTDRLTLFLDGRIAGQWGLYRSTDGGSAWIRINDGEHQWGGITALCGDMRTFGTVYAGTGGRGIMEGVSRR